MENQEGQQYRDELAEKIKSSPRENRRDILGEAKTTQEYWEADTRKSKKVQEPTEQVSDDGLTVLVSSKTLFHGSGIAGTEEFNPAEDDTIGQGLYAISESKDAIGYARIRAAGRTETPIIYEMQVENKKFVDLRKPENLLTILRGFRPFLEDAIKKYDDDPNAKWFAKSGLEIRLADLDKMIAGQISPNNLKQVTQGCGNLFSDYLVSIGYDGLIFIEGGEQGIGNHDSYVIFDPSQAKVVEEHQIV